MFKKNPSLYVQVFLMGIVVFKMHLPMLPNLFIYIIHVINQNIHGESTGIGIFRMYNAGQKFRAFKSEFFCSFPGGQK